jgi:hypothetical protein
VTTLTALPADIATDPLAQYGLVGIVIAALMAYARTSIQRERDRADRAENQVQELNNFIRTELLPKQVEGTILHKQVAEVLGDAIDVISEMKAAGRNERRRD